MGKTVYILRWIGVLPAALLGYAAIQLIVGVIYRLINACLDVIGSQDPDVFYYVHLLLYYVPKGSAFVIAGSKVAPGRRHATAIVLAVSVILFSLLVHVIAQYQSGNRVGWINYTHFTLESVGALFGVAYIVFATTMATNKRQTPL